MHYSLTPNGGTHDPQADQHLSEFNWCHDSNGRFCAAVGVLKNEARRWKNRANRLIGMPGTWPTLSHKKERALVRQMQRDRAADSAWYAARRP